MARPVRVATYNLYLGADLSLVLGDRDRAELRRNTAEVARQLRRTAFPDRAGALARLLAGEQVDLVGLQEVTTWRADGALLWDFARSLLDALEDADEPYEVVASVPTFEGSGTVEVDGRMVTLELVGANAILRRVGSRVQVSASASGTFGRAHRIRALGVDASISRGWCSVECSVDGSGERFVLVDTHTEAYDEAARDGQRDELLAMLPTGDRPLVVVGDFNTTPEHVGMAGFVDAWVAVGNPTDASSAATGCQAADLTNPVSRLSERIDYVFVRGLDVTGCRRVGADPDDRTASGLWPSDHAGLVADLGGAGAPDRERLTAHGRS